MEKTITPFWTNSRTGSRASSSKSLYKLQKKKKNVKKETDDYFEGYSDDDFEGYSGKFPLPPDDFSDNLMKEAVAQAKRSNDRKTYTLKKSDKKEKNVKKSLDSDSDYEGYTGSVSKSGKPDKRTKEYKRWKKDKTAQKKKPKKTVEESAEVLINYYGLPDEKKSQKTDFRDMSISERSKYEIKNRVKQRAEEDVYKGKRYHQQQKEIESKKLKELQEKAKQAIKERKQEPPQKFDWVEYYNKKTPGHPSYEGAEKQEAIQLEDKQLDTETPWEKEQRIKYQSYRDKGDGFITYNLDKGYLLKKLGLLPRQNMIELYSFDNEKLKKMVINAGVPIEDIIGMDFNKDIKEQLIELLNRKGL